jgi:hypothetical protein
LLEIENIPDRLTAYKAIVDELPPAHKQVLFFLLKFLNKVAANKEFTLMDTQAIATSE